MTHPHHMHVHAPPHRLIRHAGTIDRCDDLPTAGEWFRLLAGNLALIRTWWAVPMVIAHLLVRVADLVHFWRHGQTAVSTPSPPAGRTTPPAPCSPTATPWSSAAHSPRASSAATTAVARVHARSSRGPSNAAAP